MTGGYYYSNLAVDNISGKLLFRYSSDWVTPYARQVGLHGSRLRAASHSVTPFDMQIQKKYRPLFILILFVSYVFLGSFLVYKYQHPQGESLFNLGFYYGPLIKNIVTKGTYRFGIFSAGRMPFIPLFLSAIALIYNNLFFAYLIKNLLFFSIMLVCIRIVSGRAKNINRYILWAVFIYAISFPQLLLHSFSIEYGAGYLTAFLSVLFLCLLYAGDIRSMRIFILLALINSLMYLTRGVTPVLSILVCLFYYCVTRSRRVLLVFVSSLFAAIVMWGTFNLFNSGKFDILVSIKGYNLYKGNNENVLKVYPKYSIDELSHWVWQDMPKDKALNEWEADGYFISKYFAFIRSHPAGAARLFLIKSYVMFIRLINPLDKNDLRYPALQCLGVAYMLIYRIIFILCLFIALKSIFAKRCRPLFQGEKKAMASFIYLGFIFGYSLFHLIGFAHQRHVITLVPVTLFYLIWALDNKSYRSTIA